MAADEPADLTVFRLDDLPDHLKVQPSADHIRDMARQLRCRPDQVDLHTVLLVPQTNVGDMYFAWFHKLPNETKLSAVPPMLMHPKGYTERVNPHVPSGQEPSKADIAKAIHEFSCVSENSADHLMQQWWLAASQRPPGPMLEAQSARTTASTFVYVVSRVIQRTTQYSKRSSVRTRDTLKPCRQKRLHAQLRTCMMF